MKKFTANQEVTARSVCNHDCVFEGTIIKRTAKTVTVKTMMKGVTRCKIHLDIEGNEYIFPFGKYSMAPIFRA